MLPRMSSSRSSSANCSRTSTRRSTARISGSGRSRNNRWRFCMPTNRKSERLLHHERRSTVTPLSEGTILWRPPEQLERSSRLRAYMDWLAERKGLKFDGYAPLWEWSVAQIEDFWQSIWEFFDLRASAPYAAVLDGRAMPGARWFAGARLNYTEHVF